MSSENGHFNWNLIENTLGLERTPEEKKLIQAVGHALHKLKVIRVPDNQHFAYVYPEGQTGHWEYLALDRIETPVGPIFIGIFEDTMFVSRITK